MPGAWGLGMRRTCNMSTVCYMQYGLAVMALGKGLPSGNKKQQRAKKKKKKKRNVNHGRMRHQAGQGRTGQGRQGRADRAGPGRGV